MIRTLEEIGGELIEIPYTFSNHIAEAEKQIRERLAMPEYRRKRLRQLLRLCPVVKTIEVHSGLTGLIAEKPSSGGKRTGSVRCHVGFPACAIPPQRGNRISSWWI